MIGVTEYSSEGCWVSFKRLFGRQFVERRAEIQDLMSMQIRDAFKARWFWYCILCVLLWGPYTMVSKLGSREIPASTMQFLFTLGSLPVALVLLVARRFKLEKDSKGITHATVTGVLSGIGGMGLFAAYGSGGNTAVVTYQLVVLSPGASISPDGQPTISGQPSQQQSYLLDGVDNNNYQGTNQSGAPWALQPSPDAIQEFKVQTNNYSAEFGRAGGGIVNVVTKSGANQLHGDFYEFLRNAALDGRNFFAPVKPTFIQNQFGGSAGGPLVLPGVYNGRNKTFFFADYEGYRARTGTTQLQNMPPEAWRTGNFQSYLTGTTFTDPCTGATYDTGQLFDPTTTQQVTCMDGTTGYARNPIAYNEQANVINPAQIVPTAAQTAALFPSPNLGSSQYVWSPSLALDFNQFDVKVDHYWGSHDTISARYALRNTPPYGIPSLPGQVGSGVANQSRQQGGAISDTHLFSPTAVNEFRYGYTRNAFASHLLNSSENPSSLGYGVLVYQAGLLGGLPSLSFSDVSSIGAGGYLPSIAVARDQLFADTLSLMRGKHSFKIGGMYNSLWFTQPATSIWPTVSCGIREGQQPAARFQS